MRIELVPVVLGMIVLLLAGGILADAWGSPERGPMRERRRRMRATIDRRGETLVGIGFVLVGAALVGRDHWRYETASVLLGTLLILLGAAFNRRYIREAILFRGPARRGLDETQPPEPAPPRLRIR